MRDEQVYKVWDLPVRLFHWTLLLLIVILWLTGEFGGMDITVTLPFKGETYLSNMDIHALAGQGVLVLVVFRVLWGIWGSTTARFSDFLYRPSVVIAKFRALLKGRLGDATAGHNALGGLMVILMLAVLAAQSVTGLFSADDLFFEGPLTHLVSGEAVEILSGIHHQLFGVLQVLIVVHILAIGFYLLRGRNLITAMVTGKRKLDFIPRIAFSPGWLAAVSFVFAMGLLVVLKSL